MLLQRGHHQFTQLVANTSCPFSVKKQLRDWKSIVQPGEKGRRGLVGKFCRYTHKDQEELNGSFHKFHTKLKKNEST